MNSQNIICPHCSKSFDMEDVIKTKVESQVKERLGQKRETLLNELKSDFIIKEKEKIKKDIQSQLNFEYAEKEKGLNQELEDKSQQLREMHSTEAQLQTLKREMKEMESKHNRSTEQQLSQVQDQWNKKFQEERAQEDLKRKELEKQLEDQNKRTKEMLGKQTVGSQELQGEVQELVIEEFLKKKFPDDKIVEVKKGQRGADVIQIVNDGSECGKIVYESKRTKNFMNKWIDKLKDDMSEEGADFGVLVTQTMPKASLRLCQNMGFKNRIWICKFHELEVLSVVLRHSIIEISQVKLSQENREGKMDLLYDYITSPGFRERINYQMETYQFMLDDLNKEKMAIQTHWKKREIQINRLANSVTSIVGNLQGIALNEIKPIKSLELSVPSGDDQLN
ncbi:MAG: DUF2130 domain-containing protein [Flavobacteriaceae bacterium]|nr:DUF2130 domain-containing protein [Flavobacteriaceae bacterium]